MKLTRNPEAVSANFVKNSAGQVICKNDCYIQAPKAFFEGNLGVLGSDISVYGCFVTILDSGDYALTSVTAMFSLSPTSTNIKTVDDVEYYEFYFKKDTVVFKTDGLLQSSKIVYDPFRTFYLMGRVPWYISYDDFGKLFDTAPHNAGFKSLENTSLMEFLAAMCARKRGTTDSEFLRLLIQKYSDGDAGQVDYVPMGSVVASVRSSMNKISGAYAQDGIISAIVSPADTVGTVERIVRA